MVKMTGNDITIIKTQSQGKYRQLRAGWTVQTKIQALMDFDEIPTRLEPGQFGPGSDLESVTNYPCWVDVHASWTERVRLRREIKAWYQEQGGLCVTTQLEQWDRYFLHTEQEQVVFLLKWR